MPAREHDEGLLIFLVGHVRHQRDFVAEAEERTAGGSRLARQKAQRHLRLSSSYRAQKRHPAVQERDNERITRVTTVTGDHVGEGAFDMTDQPVHCSCRVVAEPISRDEFEYVRRVSNCFECRSKSAVLDRLEYFELFEDLERT